MRTDDFDFDLPHELIAQRPAEPRDAARLLVVGARLEDRGVRDLPALLRPGDVMVFNDTRVVPARLFGRRGAAKVEVTLTGPDQTAGPGHWRALARPAKRLGPGDRIDFAPDLSAADLSAPDLSAPGLSAPDLSAPDLSAPGLSAPGLSAKVAAKGAHGEITLAFDIDGTALGAALERLGAMPLPPYIKREPGGSLRDRVDYQTIYAASDGAMAAPTAGLHFTPAVMAALEARGIACVFVTLHVGPGTFLPVTAADPHDHRMQAESGKITRGAAGAVNAARATGGRVVAVGSTALRLLETAADESGALHAFSGATDIFILPGYRFRIVDLLLTNFHLPRSTLFMLVSAFAGAARMKRAYAQAIDKGYRFYSYGDACLLHPETRP